MKYFTDGGSIKKDKVKGGSDSKITPQPQSFWASITKIELS